MFEGDTDIRIREIGHVLKDKVCQLIVPEKFSYSFNFNGLQIKSEIRVADPVNRRCDIFRSSVPNRRSSGRMHYCNHEVQSFAYLGKQLPQIFRTNAGEALMRVGNGFIFQ